MGKQIQFSGPAPSAHVLDSMRAAGYETGEAPAEDVTEDVADEATEPDLDDLTVPELRAMAEALGVEATSSMRKADLIEAISEGSQD